MASAVGVGAFVSAAGKAAAVAAAKPAAWARVVLTVQISAGRTGIPAAPARDVGAVAAVPRTEAATVAGQLGALGLVQQTGVDFTQEADGGLRRVWPKIIRVREVDRYSSFLARVMAT